MKGRPRKALLPDDPQYRRQADLVDAINLTPPTREASRVKRPARVVGVAVGATYREAFDAAVKSVRNRTADMAVAGRVETFERDSKVYCAYRIRTADWPTG